MHVGASRRQMFKGVSHVWWNKEWCIFSKKGMMKINLFEISAQALM